MVRRISKKINRSGQLVPTFNKVDARPSGLLIADNYIYFSDFTHHYVVVHKISGEFVTSIGKYGHEKGTFNDPYSIASCSNGYIYVCDCGNDRVQIF